MSNNNVSVIVPAYNATAYLKKCVDSLLAQTLQQIEIILVNDASTDNTLEIMKGYERQYPEKIKVIDSLVNQRQGGARNKGIEAATGEYIGFVDSDDWADKDMYEQLYSTAKTENSDMAYCYRRQVLSDGNIEGDGATYFLPVGQVTDDTRREMLIRHVTFVQRYIYRRALFIDNGILFPAHLWYEDMMIDPMMLMYVKKISAVEKTLFNYYVHAGSTITTKNDTKFRDRIKVCKIILEEFRKRGFYKLYESEIVYLYFRKAYILASLNYLINAATPRKSVINSIRQELLTVDKDYKSNPYYGSNKFFVLIDKWLQLPGNLPLRILKSMLAFKRLSI